ncbi:hypothetical protein [Rhodococcus sp. IEGM 1408]|uniref:hypothetical protein n=1 Tax=Rhodococcus sp. IEGM 1408 TaxID=3082220 RepID=UPI0029559884|nr:hypothetical protein [Rhodococcus sp. IEGM 1408]MDV8003174.1 hypothetical protein [Rhodococcus sp. IEGM 1408]
MTGSDHVRLGDLPEREARLLRSGRMSSFDRCRFYAYAVRWDHDTLESFTEAVVEELLAAERVDLDDPRAGRLVGIARKVSTWTWEQFTERPV